MITPVLSTVAARVTITGANLLLVALAGRQLGAHGLGDISLLVLGITVVLLLAHVVGGGGLVYLVPKLGIHAVLIPAYSWALFSGAVASIIVEAFPLVPTGLGKHLVALAFLQAINSIHLNILVARERIAVQNNLLIVQAVVQLVSFAVLLNWEDASLMDYVLATYMAHTATVILSGYLALADAGTWKRPKDWNTWKALFVQGGFAQFANLFQLANYRSAYYFIEAFRGTSALGVYSVAMQLAEGSWLVPKSIGGVLYSKVSNLEERRRQVMLTTMLFKVAVLIGMVCSIALIAVPEVIFSFFFGPEVRGLRPILLAISPGLIAMSGSQVLSHFFSGTGAVKHNLVGSGLGLFVTIAVGWWLIRSEGLTGAALTASLAYATSLLYQVVVFVRLDQVPLTELLPHKGDLRKAQLIWKTYRNKTGSEASYL